MELEMAKAAPAPLDANLLGVPKGAAVPPNDVSASFQDPNPVPTTARRQAPTAAPLHIEEPRAALTVRLPVSTQERLREASHRLRREKQHIVDEALLAWLDQQGF
jgi:hypothetical protein